MNTNLNIALDPRRRRPFPDLSGLQMPQGLDLQPQPAQQMIPLPPVPQMQGGESDSDPMSQLAGMGTHRLFGMLMKKRGASPADADALSAFKAGGSL